MYGIFERKNSYGQVERIVVKQHTGEEIRGWGSQYADRYPDSVRFYPADLLYVTDEKPFNASLYRWVVLEQQTLPTNIEAYRIWQDTVFDFFRLEVGSIQEFGTSGESENEIIDLKNVLFFRDQKMRIALNIPQHEPALDAFPIFNY